MEHEILTTLQEIRGMLLVIIVLFLIFVAALTYSVLAETLPFLKPKKIADIAEDLMESGKDKEVVILCNKNLSKKPNHLTSVWWLAKAKYNLKEYDESEKLFNLILEKEPNWKTEFIVPYLEKINEIKEAANKTLQSDP